MAHSLKVVFKSDIRGIAKAGDIKNVSPGYARNYLFPRQLAFAATPTALKQWETVRQGTVAKAERLRAGAQTLADSVKAASCTLTVKASPEGKLFGSVGRQDIIQALEKSGVKLDKHALVLPKAIRQVGVTTVPVHLPGGVQTELTVTVAAELNA